MKKDIVYEKVDLKKLNWSTVRSSSGTSGSFLKATDYYHEPKTYYKLSAYDVSRGIYGHECVNEIVVDRLLDILGVEHLQYQLIHASIVIDKKEYVTYLCASNDYKVIKEKKMSLDVYYEMLKKENETPLEFCKRQGWEKYIYEMLVVDYLILNRDRHGANIEVLYNPSNNSYRLAPLFDHGISLMFSCLNEKDIKKYDVLEDKPVQCFVGSHSSYENLKLIPKKKFPKMNRLKESDKGIILEGLDGIISKSHQEKIWNMIWQRWRVYEDIRNQR